MELTLKILLLIIYIPMMVIAFIDGLVFKNNLGSLKIMENYPRSALFLSFCMWIVLIRALTGMYE